MFASMTFTKCLLTYLFSAENINFKPSKLADGVLGFWGDCSLGRLQFGPTVALQWPIQWPYSGPTVVALQWPYSSGPTVVALQ